LLVDPITIDGLDENDFRRSIENMLRHGEADSAASKLRALLEPYAGDDNILPSRFLTVSPGDVSLSGWDRLGERIRAYDRPDHQISALSIAVADPDEAGVQPAEAGKRTPYVETGYFSDDAYPFSEADRSDLLDGYSLYGCEWQGDFEETDSTLSVEGIEDLYGAVARLEAKLLASQEPCEQEIRAGSLGACYLSVLLHQAVRDTVRKSGVPRPLCVMAGSNGVYPFFDAPVVSSEECIDDGAVQSLPGVDLVRSDTEEADAGETAEGASEEGSLLSLTIRKGHKQPVIMLDPAEAEAASRIYESDAAQHMAEAGKSARVGQALTGLDAAEPFAQETAFARSAENADDDRFEEPAEVDEPPSANSDDQAGGPGRDDMGFADDAIEADRPARDAETEQPWPACPDEGREADIADSSPADGEFAAPRTAEYPDEERSAPVEERAAPDREAELRQPEPDLGPRGHSIRARIVQTAPSQATLGERIAAFLQRIENWLRGRRR
jgi:hypothetical protein